MMNINKGIVAAKINDFLLHQTSLKESSKETYRNKLLRFFNGSNNPNQINKNAILTVFESKWFKALENTTQRLYKTVLRAFLKHYELEYEYIKSIKSDRDFVRIEDIPTKEEINALLDNMHRAMDRCLVMIFLEGLRLNEARNVRIRDIVDKETHMIIYITVSKSKKRPVPVINSVPFIIEWLNQHPDRKNPEAFLFAHKRNGQISQYSQRGLQQIIGRNNNLSKRIYPHLFRHTAATNDYSNLSEKLMMKKYGWKTRDMIDRYAHLKDSSLEESILELHGIIPEKKREETIKFVENKNCARCKLQNPSTNLFCSRCGCALDIKTVIEHKEIARELESLIDKLEITKSIKTLFKKSCKELIELV